MTFPVESKRLLDAYRTVTSHALRTADRAETLLEIEKQKKTQLTAADPELVAELRDQLQKAIDERDAARNSQEDLEKDLTEAEERCASLSKDLADLAERPAPTPASELLAATVAQRDEARAAQRQADTARKTAEQAELAALADLSETKQQHTETMSELQEKTQKVTHLDHELAKAKTLLMRQRESIRALSEQVNKLSEHPTRPSVTDAPAVDLTNLRARLNATEKWIRKDDPEKTMSALSGAMQELNRLEGNE